MHNFCNLTVPSACKRVFLAVLCKKETQKSHRLCISASTMASCWSGRRGSNSLPPPWQGGALPDELRPHTDNAFLRYRGPRKDLRSKGLGGEEESLTRLSTWCLRSESNQWHGDFQSPALPTELQRHNRCICPCTLPNSHESGPPQRSAKQRFVGKRRNFSVCCGGPACRTARQTADIPTKRPGSGSNRRPPA